jgi:hypothetical protein
LKAESRVLALGPLLVVEPGLLLGVPADFFFLVLGQDSSKSPGRRKAVRLRIRFCRTRLSFFSVLFASPEIAADGSLWKMGQLQEALACPQQAQMFV